MLLSTMRTTLDLPDDLMTAVKIQAALESRTMKDIIADALRRDLGLETPVGRRSVRDIQPVSAGQLITHTCQPDDRMEEMLDARGHRY